MNHEGIYKLNPSVVMVQNGIAYDADGNVVEYDEDAAAIEGAKFDLREQRNALLAETDWWASSDLTMTQAQTDYRQALRDITDHANWPNLADSDWPTKP